jgi:hypothetical protein
MSEQEKALQDKACLALGREVLRMMQDLLRVGHDPAYARREIKYPNGSMAIVLTNNHQLADAFEAAAAKAFTVEQQTPFSAVN